MAQEPARGRRQMGRDQRPIALPAKDTCFTTHWATLAGKARYSWWPCMQLIEVGVGDDPLVLNVRRRVR